MNQIIYLSCDLGKPLKLHAALLKRAIVPSTGGICENVIEFLFRQIYDQDLSQRSECCLRGSFARTQYLCPLALLLPSLSTSHNLARLLPPHCNTIAPTEKYFHFSAIALPPLLSNFFFARTHYPPPRFQSRIIHSLARTSSIKSKAYYNIIVIAHLPVSS